MRLRRRGPFDHFVFGNLEMRNRILDWKKAGNAALARGETPAGPPDLGGLAEILAGAGLDQIDIVTVPPPSFHDYAPKGWYPAEILAGQVCRSFGRELAILWPDRYHKKGKVWHANISKVYPAPAVDVRGRFVLVLDEITTTGLTLTAACHAIAEAGGYPVGIAIS